MTVYIFDSSSFRVLNHYFPERFPTFWTKFDEATSGGTIVSVREVRRELDRQVVSQHVQDWVKANKSIFHTPNGAETDFVKDIFAVPHFQYLVKKEQTLRGRPVADPFVIAAAKVRNGVAVTEEAMKKNAAKIPNVCAHFGIECTDAEGFMEQQGWSF